MKNVLRFLYFLIVGLLIFCLGLFFMYGKVTPDMFLISLCIITLFPFFHQLVSYVSQDFSAGNMRVFYKVNIFKYITLFLFVLFAGLNDYSLVNTSILFFFFFSLLFRLDSRISFIGALLLLIYTPVYLVFGDKVMAEQLSIYAYYLLIIGVVNEILYSVFQTHITGKENVPEEKRGFAENLSTLFTQKIQRIKTDMLKEISADSYSNGGTQQIFLDIFVIRVIQYFFKKIQKYMREITLFLFILFILSVFLLLKFNISTTIIYLGSLFLFCYISTISSHKNSQFLSLFDFSAPHNKRVFQNTNLHIMFAGLGLFFSMLITFHYSIGHIPFFISMIIFCSFAIFYSLIFTYFLQKTVRKQKKNKKIKRSFWGYIRYNIYFFLSFITIGITAVFIILVQEKIYNTQPSELLEDIKKREASSKSLKNIKEKEDFSEGQEDKEWSLVTPVVKKITHTEQLKEANERYKNKKNMSGEASILDGAGSADTENINTPNPHIVQKNMVNVKEYYTFSIALLRKGTVSSEVKKLEEIMKKLGYFSKIPDTSFTEYTKTSLIKLLQDECQWPQTTLGILGTKAKDCLYSLKIDSK